MVSSGNLVAARCPRSGGFCHPGCGRAHPERFAAECAPVRGGVRHGSPTIGANPGPETAFGPVATRTMTRTPRPRTLERPRRRAALGWLALAPTSFTTLSTLSQPMPTPNPADPAPASDADDPFLWLEDVQGQRALAWVRERNAESEARLRASPGFDALREQLREVLDSRQQIPYVSRLGPWLYNLWRDAANPRGLWRRTTLDEYRKPQPQWESVLDLDALGHTEGKSWVWGGVTAHGPAYRRCLMSLSVGGADAAVVREFDLVAKRFIAATDGGFVVPEAKTSVTWIDADTVYIGTDFGPGSLTDSGYPRVIKRWRRGQPLAAADTVFEGDKSDVAAWVSVDATPGFARTAFGRHLDFYRGKQWLVAGPVAEAAVVPEAKRVAIDKPDDASLTFWREWAVVELRSDWPVGGDTHRAGSLLVADAAAFLGGQRRFTTLFAPTATRSLAGWTATRRTLLVTLMDNVASRLEEWRWQPGGEPARDGQASPGRWNKREVRAPSPGTLSVAALHDPLLEGTGATDPLAERYLLNATDFLHPDSLQLATTGNDEREPLKARPRFYDADGMKAEQRFATSRDGTRVPYFIVWPKGMAASNAASELPTLLYGYGGFEVAMQPFYSGTIGRAWTGRGGAFVLANIRGGGEFGPAWHQAALKANKQKSYDDFIAVAEDLVKARITRPARLAIQGGSNGGLLVAAVMLQRPDLFGAVSCQVPLLDMRRYHRLLAGASWMAEYGNPDDAAEWEFIRRYSPYHNVPRAPAAEGTARGESSAGAAGAARRLPALLVTTSTRDDRVHPGHARKFVARLAAYGHWPLYWENIEGGHGGAADNAQRSLMMALEYMFLWRSVGAADLAAGGTTTSSASSSAAGSSAAAPQR
jgi:prolyl oligopeptidase